MLGFTEESAAKQRDLERRILGKASGKQMEQNHRVLTSEPHHAGTAANVRAADYYAKRLREFGFDEIEMHKYEVLLPRPVIREVTLLSPEYHELKLTEPPFPEDEQSSEDGVLPPYNAYAADGEVEAEVVYVNYGIPSDFKALDSLGVSVRGKIVIARYGKSWRGIKPRLASERGAVGCLLYSDPEDDGYVKGNVIPDGKWRPEFGVQRGSVMDMPIYPGDPQTPMRPSKRDVDRIPLDDVVTFQKIPVLPISYGDALPILRHLGGHVALENWRGGLPITYHVGPGPAKVRMRLKSDWSVRPIVNVIGILRGYDEPEKMVMVGSHRDAWTFGGRDPISGATSLLETARLIGNQTKRGHRPKRSIAIASWDGEEYGLIGSVEYGEEYGEELQGNLIAYLNRESYTSGDFGVRGVHSLQPLINQITCVVRMPGGNGTVYESWMAKVEDKENETVSYDGDTHVRIGALGSGSDYTVFLHHLGIPSVNLGFSSGNGIYHSRYDSHWFFTTYGDPEFAYGETLAELVAVFLLRLASADIYPLDHTSTAETIGRYIDELDEEAHKRELSEDLDFSGLRKAVAELSATAAVLQGEIERILVMNTADLDDGALAEVNNLLLKVEQLFLHTNGLPKRPWYRHQLYAPGLYTGYGVKTLPGVREAIEKGDVREAKQMMRVLQGRLDAVRVLLLEGIVLSAGIKKH